MPFKLAISPTYWVKVQVSIPEDDGKVSLMRFRALCERLDTDELAEVQRQIVEENLSDKGMAVRILRGWDEVVDENGSPLAYTDDARDAFLKIHGVPTAICKAYLETLPKAKAKN